MPVDFQDLSQQFPSLREEAQRRSAALDDQLKIALDWLDHYSDRTAELQRKIDEAASQNAKLRCARPTAEAFAQGYPLPPAPKSLTLLAADGSQIFASHHQAIEYSLVNVGTVSLFPGQELDPERQSFTTVRLGLKTEEQVSAERDLAEREKLAELALAASSPALAFTDGPLELWGREGQGHYTESLDKYLKSLQQLMQAGVGTAGYVDRPAANYVVDLLEIAARPLEEISARKQLDGVRDIDLFIDKVKPGERSALFKSVSSLARRFEESDPGLALYFFYLNVGREGKPWLARVEVPYWVVTDTKLLDTIHATLVDQANIMGARPYPYILHRAHEEALVSYDEKRLIDQQLARSLGIYSEGSNKQANKNMSTQKSRYSR